jgi:hypothetical protein
MRIKLDIYVFIFIQTNYSKNIISLTQISAIYSDNLHVL